MNYTKPEVAVLGQAVRVVEGTQTKSPTGVFDPRNPVLKLIPAYDLDE